MRVVECNVCGAPLNGDSDEELATVLREHLQSAHEQEVDADAVAATVEHEAYEAMDS